MNSEAAQLWAWAGPANGPTEALDDLRDGLVGEPALGEAGVDQGQCALVIAAGRSLHWEPLSGSASACGGVVSSLVAGLPRASGQIARRDSPRQGIRYG